MFLQELTHPQRRMFMALAKRMVLADWKLEQHEQDAIDRVEAELGESLTVEAKDLLSNDNLHVLDTDRSRRIVVYELLVLAQADLQIDDAERHVFNDLAQNLNIPKPVMTALESLSESGYALILTKADDTGHRAKVESVIGG